MSKATIRMDEQGNYIIALGKGSWACTMHATCNDHASCIP
jgi:hypothetical protein